MNLPRPQAWERAHGHYLLSPCPHLIKGQCFPLPSSVLSSGRLRLKSCFQFPLPSLKHIFSDFLRHPPGNESICSQSLGCVSPLPFISGFACWTAIYLPCLFLVNGNNAGALWNLVSARTPGHLRAPV